VEILKGKDGVTLIDIPTIFNRYKASIGRVHKVTGERRDLNGTCFLVAPRFALTCYHVVFTGKGVVDNIEIRFQGHLHQPLRAKVHLSDRDIDIALLELDGEVSLLPLPVDPHETWGAKFYTFGYPLAHGGGGVTENGSILGPSSTASAAPRLELRAEPNRIQQGFSGGPVFVVASDTLGYSIGCISETGSKEYPDAPACATLSSFIKLYPEALNLFSEVIAPTADDLESTLRALSDQPQPESLWRFTQRLVNKEGLTDNLSSESLDIEAVANKVYETVRDSLEAAKQSDEARVRKLSIIIAGLRTKYQQLRIDVRSLETAARELQRNIPQDPATSDDPPLLREAEIVSDDLQRIPGHLLNFASSHGARIHYTVLQGASYRQVAYLKLVAKSWARQEVRRSLAYTYENIARLFEAAASLIQFDVTSLSRGYLNTGWVSDVDAAELSRLIVVAQTGEEPAVLVYEQKNDTDLKLVARLVARKHGLGELAVRRHNGRLTVLAAGAQYLYRWGLCAATPVTEFSIGEDDATGIHAVDFGDRAIEEDVFISTVSKKVYHLVDGKLEETINQKADIVWNNADEDGFHTANTSSKSPHSVISTVIVGGQTARRTKMSAVTLNEVLSDVISFEGLQQGSPVQHQPHPALQQVDRLQLSETGFYEIALDELLGSRCLVLLAGLDASDMGVIGSTVSFLDPDTLRPIRTPILTTLSIMNCRIVHYQRSWLLFAALLCGSVEFNPKIAVWDVSDIARRECPKILGTWHESGLDALYLNVTRTRKSWEAYYLLTQPKSEGESLLEEVWKFRWPQKTIEKILTLPPGHATGLSIWHA
jgi:hypothetical protein